jgi:glycosyltransferase involved in cell wall biosynthesis
MNINIDIDITIIIPIYNGKAYLDEAVQSIINQTYSRWKLLLVDDKSTDHSRDIIEKYLEDSRIAKIYHDKNHGLYGSLIEVIPYVTSEWIVILMQDDRLKPEYLEELMSVIENHPDSKALWGTEDLIDQNGQILREGMKTSRIEIINPGISPWFNILQRGCVWTISGSFTRRDLFISVPFRSDLPHCGDYDWLLRAVREESFIYYDKALIEIRIHDHQASSTNLRIGQDTKEHYSIVKNNLCLYSNEVSLVKGLYLSFQWIKVISKRIMASSLKGRFNHTALLGLYALKYLSLPFICKRINSTVNNYQF